MFFRHFANSQRGSAGILASSGAAACLCSLWGLDGDSSREPVRAFWGKSESSSAQTSPFEWKELEQGLKKRKEAQDKLMKYMVEMREHVDICKRTTTDLRQQDRCVVELQVRVNKESNEIIYEIGRASCRERV